MTAFTTTAEKIFTRDALREQAAAWRAQGRTIVLTNGCFDLLHAGHINSLEAARALGDLLIVGLNSDASVRRLKGPERPLNTELDRARVMAALSCVDAVTIFNEATPISLLSVIQPQIFAKGGDYAVETLPERGVIESYGGKIMILPLVPGLSTTNLIAAARA